MDLLVVELVRCKRDVSANRAREEKAFLGNKADGAAELGKRVAVDVDAASVDGVVKV